MHEHPHVQFPMFPIAIETTMPAECDMYGDVSYPKVLLTSMKGGDKSGPSSLCSTKSPYQSTLVWH